MHNQNKGRTAEQLAILLEEEFWFGYRRGLNRFRYGKIFADKEELNGGREIADSSPNGSSPFDIARRMGYRSGCEGLSVEEVAVHLEQFLRGEKEH